MRSIRNHVSVCIHNLVVTPRIVQIVYHNVPCVVKYRNNIPLQVLSKDVSGGVIM